jgi:hypothetical protein
MSKVTLIELNEVNFDAVRYYVAQGKLPTFARLLEHYGYSETTSEDNYEELEPWIQWVTAHTGLSLKEHGVFRLGDIVNHDIPQIWETLEAKGYRVGAISPMNAKNRLKNAPFFVPDPWTQTPTSGPKLLGRLHKAIGQVVGDNAKGGISGESIFWLLIGLLRFAQPRNYIRYFKLAIQSRRKSWLKPMFLDLFLGDIFMRLNRQTKPDFSSLFLNAAAHIQHHYMFNSPAYADVAKNPTWYIDAHMDPMLEVYALYDVLLAQIINTTPNTHFMIATGLHQEPHPTVTYYWRLKDHTVFLHKIGVVAKTVEPLMSRDFIIRCETPNEAAQAEARLNAARDRHGVALFEVDNRGADLFVMLTYPNDIAQDMSFSINTEKYTDFKADVVFVAIKNGQHNGMGYYLSNKGKAIQGSPKQIKLSKIPELVTDFLRDI